MNNRAFSEIEPGLATYDAVAAEYYDRVAHPTCFNFNRLSRLFIDTRFPEPWDESAVVEVGAGDSAVAALLHARGYGLAGLTITDGSAAMAVYSDRWRTQGATISISRAENLGGVSGRFAMLVSSLGDPYNTRDFWREAHRVLKPGGRLLFTTPSFEWGRRFRHETAPHNAEFLVGGHEVISLPSFVLPLAAQVAMMEAAGLAVIHFESLGQERLHPAEPLSPKLAVFGDDRSSLVWGFELEKPMGSGRNR
ncbi:MAG: methyltransferase domain-containing protein [Sphingomonadaceae bacterium]